MVKKDMVLELNFFYWSNIYEFVIVRRNLTSKVIRSMLQCILEKMLAVKNCGTVRIVV
jgi:hypothetical protein